MSGNNSKPAMDAKDVKPEGRRRSPWPLALVAGLFVVAAFLTWYGTWFGRSLSDDDLARYLKEENKPRHVQHALFQIAERINNHDEGVKKFYPQVVSLVASPVTEVRQAAAWVMGQDNSSEEFHAALLKLVEDREPIVRRNAAVQLVRFRDARGLPELRAILKPYDVKALAQGRVDNALPDNTNVTFGTLLARIEKADKGMEELRSPLSGVIRRVGAGENKEIQEGETLFSIAPDGEFVWEALRALYVVGEAEDLKEVERYAQGVEHMPERIKEQAAMTARAIRDRSKDNNGSGSSAR
ncbi:MAG TPA: HEAT repeat domain-containing protein [Pyrinomonadaceae bacterium]|nr:HEAT repeat domain-containing protein [Pyrinomonadaceae bacterium]